MAISRNIFIRTLITYLVGCGLSVLFLCVVLPLLTLPASWRHKSTLFFQVTSWWSRFIIKIAGIEVVVSGLENLSAEPSIIVMNHASALDIVLVEKIMGSSPRIWLGKNEYSKMPVLNWILKRMHVLVDAQSPTHAARALKMLHNQAVTNDAHILLFPEGARFSDGSIHRFFKGFAILAGQLKRSVIPVYIHQAQKVYPKGSFLIESTLPISLIIGGPLKSKKSQSHEEFVAEVRDWFLAQGQHIESVGKSEDLV